MAEAKDLPVLIGRVVHPPENADDAAAAVTALRVASQRMADREACAEQIAAALATAGVVLWAWSLAS